MTNGRGLYCGCRLWGAILLVGGIGFSVGGCGSMLSASGRPLDAITPKFGSKAKQEAFERQVENDPFPTAGNVGL